MEEQHLNGGLQYVPQIAVQYVYLDFDGELTSYNGEILTVDTVEVQDSALTQERIADILSELNARYVDQNVIFVTEKPETAEYSTIYIGKTSAFDPYGSFAGVAETIDENNSVKNDNAFVNLDSTATDAEIITTIAHETAHLLGTLDHGGEGLNAYGYIYHVSSGVTSTGVYLRGASMSISNGGVANSTTVASGGTMSISNGGVVNKTTVNVGGSMCIFSGGVANNTTVNTFGSMCIFSGGVANSTTVIDSGYIYIFSGGVANSTTVEGGGRMYIEPGGTATHIIVQSEATLRITVASNTYIQGTYAGSTFEMKDGRIDGYTINNSGYMYISSGGVANSTTVNHWGSLYISSGGVANKTTVNAVGSMRIYSGGVANSTTVNSNGYICIYSGGVANSTAVNGGSMYISSGGVANSTTVNSGGGIYISSGGTALEIVENGGYVYVAEGANVTFASNTISGLTLSTYIGMTVHSNTVANSTTVASGGTMSISSGGTANSTTVNYGYIVISSGGTANSTTLSGGSYYYEEAVMSISRGGVANSTSVNSGGVMSISSGGTALEIVENGGYVYVAEGANVTFASNTVSALVLSNFDMTVHSNTIANSTTVNGGNMFIYNGGVANCTTVQGGYILSGGTQFKSFWVYIRSGGVANSTTVNSGGGIYISSGGVANSTTVNSNGDIYIYSGGVANSTTVNSGGGIYISSGGTALEIVENGGYVYVADGANVTFVSNTINALTVNNDMTVHSNTVANSTSVNYRMYISNGGVANSTTVNSNGDIYIYSGGVANSTTVNSGGGISISSGGTATNILVSIGGVLCMIVASNTYIQGTSNGSAFEMNDARIDGFTVNPSGYMYISSGGVANKTTVNNVGSMRISSGGVANSTAVNGGNMFISNGGVANSTAVNGGNMFINNGGVANSTTVNPSGIMYISNGGVANSTTVNPSGVIHIQFGGTANSTTLSGGSYSDEYAVMYISRGGVANSTTVNRSGNLYISSGGVANSTTVNSSGRMNISSGGTANSTTVNSSGYMYIFGTANSTTVNSSGVIHIQSGGTADYTTVRSYGYIVIHSGGVANRTTVNSGGIMYIGIDYHLGAGTANSTTVNSGGNMYISSGGTALEIKENGGYVYVASGANVTFASNTISGLMLFYTSMTVHSNTVANSTTVNYGGRMNISSGGVANCTTVNSGGCMNINTGGIAKNITVKAEGSVYISDYGKGTDIVVESAGEIDLSRSGGSVSNLTLKAGGFLNGFAFGEDKSLSGNGKIILSDNICISGNEMFISSGGSVENVIVKSAYMQLASGAEVKNTTLLYGGSMFISGGASHGGSLYIEKGAVVSAYSDSYITLSIAGRSVNDGYLINDLSRIQGLPQYILEVSSTQEYGQYKIAQGAADFQKYFVVRSELAYLGTLTVNGAALDRGKYCYSLVKTDGDLLLNITAGDIVPPDVPVIFADVTSPTNKNVTVSAVFAADSVKNEYSLNNSEWKIYRTDIVFTENGTVAFRSTDKTGNVSEEISYTVDNIDKIAPVLEITGNAADWTDQDIELSADSDDGVIEYFDGSEWIVGDKYTVVSNGEFKFRATDLAGNVTEKSVVVDKIDKTLPTLSITGNVSSWTNKDVVLSAAANDASSGVKSVEYSFDNVSWTSGSSVTVSENKTVYFRVTDNAGNITSDSVIIDKIDKSAPVFQNIELSSEAWTFDPITVVPTVTDDIDFTLTYRIGSGVKQTYYGGSITIDSPAYIYFTAVDAAGNSSTRSVYVKAGYVPVSSGVISSGLQVSRGILDVFAGGRAENTMVSSGGTLLNSGIVSALKASSGAIISGGGRFYLTSDTTIASGIMGQTKNQSRIGASTFSNFVAAHDWHVDQKLLLQKAVVTSGGSMTLYRGASATILENHGYTEVLSKANARSVTVFSGAELNVNGGIAAGVVINQGGYEKLINGGSGLRTSVYGSQTVVSGGIANSTTVSACGLQTVGTKGLAKSGFIIGGTQIVSGGSSYRDDFSGGVQSITDGGTALETSMTGGARQVVSRRGTAEKTEICYGEQYVYGVVRSTAITSGSQFIYSGGSAEMTAVSSGTQYINSGGIVSQTSVTDGTQLLFSGASAVDNTINAGALQQISAFASACNTFVTSGGSCWIDFDGFSENVKIFDGGMITLSGTVKNLTLTQNALYDFTMETAVFQGNLDCYLKPAELEILNEILMFSELESLTLRVNATDFGQDQYDVFSTEYNDSLEYNFILVLDGGKTVSMRDNSHYWYNGECYSLEYSEDDWQYYLNKSTQEKTKVLLSGASNIDVLEAQSSKVNWNRNSYQDYGEVIAIQETGTGKTVYLNTGVSVKGLLQNATAVDFVNGGSLQFGTNTFTIDMYSRDDAEAVVYGVHNASIVQRRLASLSALPQGVTMNISAAAANGSACAAAFINDLTGMAFSGGIAGTMQVEAAGYAADARGIYAAGTTIVTEPVTGSAAISADAAGGDAYAIGISELEADDFDADWNISATSENGHAAAVGITAKSLGQWTAVSDLLVTATAEKTAQAYGFAASDHAGTPAVEEFSVSELFKGTMQVRASGYDAEAVGIESKLSLNCNMGAEITVAAQGRRNASALGINVLASTYLAGSVEVAASGEQTARAVGVNDMGNSHVTGTISIEALSESGNAFACGWLGHAGSLSAELTVYAEGSNEVKAFAFTDYFDTASGGSLNTLDTNGKISVTAVSVNVNDPAMTPVYAIGGRINESVAGSICVSAASENTVQETHAKALHAEELTVTGVVGASAATQAVAVAANSENTQLAMTVSGTLFAGNAALNGSNDELLALLASPMDDLDTLTAAKDRIKNEAYAVYAYDENDSVTLEKGAAVIGNMALAGGSNTVTISNGAYYYGDINAENGDLTVSFVLDSQKEERAIITGDLEDVSVLNVDVSKIKADGRYRLVSGFDNGFAPTSVQVTHSGASVTLTVGNMNFISAADSGRFRCFIENNELIFEAAGCQQSIIRDVTADGSGVSWSASPGDFTAELSRDGFRNVLSLQLENNAVSTYGMPSGTWQWQVQYTGENEVVAGNTFSAYASPGVSTYTAKEDGFTDLFMLTPDGVWAAGYAAQHSGMPDDWGGTGEVVLLDGKNRIADLFEGAADANVLVLTDDANGDALFVDDIYTALGSGARISRIDEIRAGDGDDIVDMTSQRFTYIGNGVKIYGGLGNDTIWANNGSNTLFGDAGNDRIVGGSGDDVIIGGAGDDSMHGGGGSDIFCFDARCGKDIVEQLSDGRVTLYFEADTGYWDPEKCTYYFDADNSVSVTGVGNDRIELFFGAAAELPEGCFDEAASEKIFEDKSKGMLA